ncbi:CLUMA_CG018735, isoform A [Clunio marinus]|uniref:CLUMA_CG018735, isoform A n=1 Tax=Clunio marinus TaxID=568069 RepID=A0A1J1J047_9DIPT|nr:CLUMA_CG018735, isoform A [Clunio marinus]
MSYKYRFPNALMAFKHQCGLMLTAKLDVENKHTIQGQNKQLPLASRTHCLLCVANHDITSLM